MADIIASRRSRRTRGWRFGLVTLAALLLALSTALLGRWQLARAHEKEALQAAIVRSAQLPALDGAALAGEGGQALHRRVQLRGQWLEGSTIYLDNRQMQGRPGFYVFTALRLADAPASTVLVQRGWIARDFLERTRLAPVHTPVGEVLVAGRTAGAPARLFELASTTQDSGASRIRQNLTLAAYGAELSLALLPLTVVQEGAASDGLQRDWAASDSGVDKHYAYAFQWFGLSGLVTVLYVWFQLIRRFVRTGGR